MSPPKKAVPIWDEAVQGGDWFFLPPVELSSEDSSSEDSSSHQYKLPLAEIYTDGGDVITDIHTLEVKPLAGIDLSGEEVIGAIFRASYRWSTGVTNEDETVLSAYGIKIKYTDLLSLAPINVVKENIITVYFKMIETRHPEKVISLDIGSHLSLARFRGVNFFGKEILLMPCYEEGDHWTLIVVKIKEKTINK